MKEVKKVPIDEVPAGLKEGIFFFLIEMGKSLLLIIFLDQEEHLLRLGKKRTLFFPNTAHRLDILQKKLKP